MKQTSALKTNIAIPTPQLGASTQISFGETRLVLREDGLNLWTPQPVTVVTQEVSISSGTDATGQGGTGA